jgi:molecular chaperone DnaK
VTRQGGAVRYASVQTVEKTPNGIDLIARGPAGHGSVPLHDEDKARREEVETRNEADNAVYRSEKMLKDNADKISGDDKSKIESAVTAVKEALKGSDAAAIKSASEKLNEAWQAVSAELYKAAAAKAQADKTQTGSTASGETKSEEKSDKKDEGPIIDAEVVDEKK